MKFKHEYLINAPQQMVVNFHQDAASMSVITPPPLTVKFQRAPQLLADGDEIAFTLGLGPFHIHWLARIENLTSTGFVDRQLSGPFKEWIHTHSFLQVDENTTKVVDQVQACLDSLSLLGLVGWLMWLGVPFLFFYRSRKTRFLLEGTGRVVQHEPSETPGTILNSHRSKENH